MIRVLFEVLPNMVHETPRGLHQTGPHQKSPNVMSYVISRARRIGSISNSVCNRLSRCIEECEGEVGVIFIRLLRSHAISSAAVYSYINEKKSLNLIREVTSHDEDRKSVV